MMADDPPRESLSALFLRFLRFGCLAFGGPVAQIAMVRRELVDEAQWLTPEQFNRLLAAYQVLPGPEAHELCVHLGTLRAGRIGGFLAGLGFMLPGFLIVLAIAAIYARISLDQPPLPAILLGMQVAVIALIVRAVHRIGEHVIRDRWLAILALLAGIASIGGIAFWISLPAAGIAYFLVTRRRIWIALKVLVTATGLGIASLVLGGTVGESASHAIAAPSAWLLLISGLKAGLLTFGGAYTAIPFVRDDIVGRGWVSQGTFLDGLALSGVVPAPLIIFATFVGYQAAGLAGAVAITVGMFLPAFAFGMLFTQSIERITADVRLHAFLDGVAAGVVGLIAATAIELGMNVATAIERPVAATAIFACCLAIAYGWKSKFNVLAIVALGAVGGAVLIG